MKCLVGTDDGLCRVDTDTGVVEPLGLQGSSVRAVHRGRDGRLWAGTGALLRASQSAEVTGIHVREDGRWTPVARGQITQGWSFVERPGDDGAMLVGALPPAIFSSEDRGATWNEVESLQFVENRDEWTFFGGPETAHVRTIAVCPALPGVIVAGIEVGGVVVSEDGGATWEDRTGPVDPDVHAVHLFRRAPGRMMVTCQTGVFVTDDLGRSWETRPKAGGYFVPIVACPHDRVFYSTSVEDDTPVYRSDDGGHTWRKVGSGLPTPSFGAANVAMDPDAPDHVVYAGNTDLDGELYFSKNGGDDWELIAQLPSTPRRVIAA